jgi:uncharacterized protein
MQTAEDYEEFFECARYGEAEDVSAFLSAGGSACYADAEGTTALHKAAANGHVDVMRLLLAAGATHVRNAAGNTPLHWACLNGFSAAAELILARCPSSQVDIYAKNAAGRSAFTEALSNGHESLARTMLAHVSAEPPAHMSDAQDEELEGEGEDADLFEDAGAAAMETTDGVAGKDVAE